MTVGRGAMYTVDTSNGSVEPVLMSYASGCLDGVVVTSDSEAYVSNVVGTIANVLKLTTTDGWMTADAIASQKTECAQAATVTLKDDVPYVTCLSGFIESVLF